ncbi:hypothetical protein RvY_06687-2 [Ramazzottius varieornatus]|uniref:Uncharacterized protein n=1 Tax=Ramazzottius varieornatus TaxID=947166 RepID=A0A1D1V5N8_RAMVA|nr:hypothetical protein RvY_06687-2 [Ramazzottius varieornatus]
MPDNIMRIALIVNVSGNQLPVPDKWSCFVSTPTEWMNSLYKSLAAQVASSLTLMAIFFPMASTWRRYSRKSSTRTTPSWPSLVASARMKSSWPMKKASSSSAQSATKPRPSGMHLWEKSTCDVLVNVC